jgi:hypothetical protein
MILTLTIECVSGAYLKESCLRVIEIDQKASLYDLHGVIQDAVEFGRDHPFEFFLANSSSPWAKKQWLTEKDEWEDKEERTFVRSMLIRTLLVEQKSLACSEN